MSIDLESIECRRIVAGGNDDAAATPLPAHLKGNVGRGVSAIHQKNAESISCKHFSGYPREAVGLKSPVVADEDDTLGVLDRFEILGCRLCRVPYVFEGEGIGDDGPPAVGAELDRQVHS